MPYQAPPPAPTISGDYLTISRFLNDTQLVARRLRTIAEQRFIATRALTGRMTTTSGSMQFETSEVIYTDRPVEQVAPGADYPLTPLSTGPLSQVNTIKWGQDTYLFDEAISRQKLPVVQRAMVKMVNTAAKNVDGVSLSLIASAVTQNQGVAGTNNWTGAGTPTILRDLLNAAATIRALNQGYEPNMLLINDLTWAAIASDPTLINTMRRENAQNAVYSGELNTIAGVQIVPTPNLPASGAWLIDTNALGGILSENLPGNYESAGELLESKSIREDANDRWRLRVRATFAPYIIEPNAAIKINNGQ